MTTAIVWFRRDLRLADNPALAHALQGYESVLPVYVHAPEEEAPWSPGGAQRVWLHLSLENLARDLRSRGSRLLLRHGPTLAALRALCRDTGAKAVFWNRLYEPAVIARDTRIKAALREDGVHAQSHNAALLVEPWAVKTTQGEPYRVFTPFWKAIRACAVAAPAPSPRRFPEVGGKLRSEPLEALDLLPRIRWDDGIRAAWTPGEPGADGRLRALCSERLPGYAQARDRPAEAHTSALSPHLHHGEIGPRQVWHAVRNRGGADADAFLRELGWREFAHHVLYHFPTTPEEPLDARFRNFPWAEAHAAELRAWQAGRTGIPMVDAGMLQLWRTGWMHNRVRMIVASFLTKNLLIPWQEGARWFWDTLVDADLANNSLGWQWASGSGADAAPFFRIFNPVRQGERFDAGGEYVRHWIPTLANVPERHLHAPWEAPDEVRERLAYPAPMVDLKASRQRALDAFDRIKKGSG